MIGHADLGLQDDVDRPGFQGLKQGLRPRLGQGRTHHHRDRPLGHQLAQEGDAVHARHLDVEGDDVRNFLGNALGGDERIGRDADHLDLRIGFQDRRQGLPNRGRVINDQNADLVGGAHGSYRFWKTVLAIWTTGRSIPTIDSEWPRKR